MLQSLFIQNYALIDTLDIRFDTGFSVITGETGAGKSIILGAIGLLLGQRADTKAIKKGASRCTIEAHFQIGNYHMEDFFERNDLTYDPECILRREVMASGKSRAFINDTPAPLSLMKELGEMLIDVHSQHQNLLLNTEGFQLNVVDIIAHKKRPGSPAARHLSSGQRMKLVRLPRSGSGARIPFSLPASIHLRSQAMFLAALRIV